MVNAAFVNGILLGVPDVYFLKIKALANMTPSFSEGSALQWPCETTRPHEKNIN